MIEAENALVLVAEIEGEVIGFLCAGIECHDEDYVSRASCHVDIYELSVTKIFQKQGAGFGLITEAEKCGKSKKACETAILAYAFNENTLDFYKHNGFEPYGIQLKKKID